MSAPPSFRRSRGECTSSLDMSPSLFRRFQSKKSSSKTPTESLAASQPPPRYSHHRMLSQDNKRPLVIYYSPNHVGFDDSSMDASMYTDGEMSEDESITFNHFDRDGEDQVDSCSKKPNFAASLGLRDTMSSNRKHGNTFMRMSQSFGRASELIDISAGDRRKVLRRAARQSVKYDVTWQKDDESSCCQVCFAMFTKLSRRRHHCRVCGCLVCGACSQDQVSLTDKFTTPRRACVACCTLLQAMARAGDDRVKVVEPDTTSATPIKRRHHSVPATSTYNSLSEPAPAATPRYRDRLTEVRRVMAAGKLSRRRGSSEKKMYVVSSRWLRSWLAFTSSASNSDPSCNPGYGFDMELSIPSPSNDEMESMGRAPGPIDNLPLLELSRGKLMRRPGLIRDLVTSGDAASVGEDADFQLLSPEVWEVFQRLYGGAPAIYVNLSSTDPTAWIVDVSSLLASGHNAHGAKVQVPPAAERALISRHESDNAVSDVRPGPIQEQTPTESSLSTPKISRHTISNLKEQHPKSPSWNAISSSSSRSLDKEEDQDRNLLESGKLQLDELESDVAAMSVGATKTSTESDDDMRATTSARSPTAALAASAFAVAMKQARLNAQKAIDDRASRVIAA